MALNEVNSQTRSWRYTLGFWMFTIPFVLIVTVPVVVPFFVTSTTEAAAIIGGVILAGEIVWFASIPLLGKAGFKELKGKAFGLIALPKGPIGRARHTWGIRFLGLALLLDGLVLIGLLIGYFYLGEARLDQPMIGASFETEARLFIGVIVASALSFVAGVYMVGAPFFERMQHAFEWQESDHGGHSHTGGTTPVTGSNIS